MTFNTEAQYWVHIITHHPDAVVPMGRAERDQGQVLGTGR